MALLGLEVVDSFRYALLVTGGIIGAVGDLYLVRGARNVRIGELLIGGLLWLGMAGIFAFLARKENLGPTVILMLLTNILAALFIGWWRFGEQLNYWQWVGVGVTLVGICLMEYGHK